ncbi:MAG TPA: BPTI/Kunitz domain-containing protein [Polyangiaceae bacterium]
MFGLWCAALASASCAGKFSRETQDPDPASARSGSPPSATCALPADPGTCLAIEPAYYHDQVTGLCTPFTYGGCGGNQNRFDSLAACVAACDAPSDIDHCTDNSQCMLTVGNCCACGANATSEVLALRVDAFPKFSGSRCATVDCACGGAQSISPYLVATCQKGICIPVDLREAGATSCSSDSQCTLRSGSQCCETCSVNPNDWIAIGNGSILSSLVCGSVPPACPHCLPQPPGGGTAVCFQGQCQAEFLLN